MHYKKKEMKDKDIKKIRKKMIEKWKRKKRQMKREKIGNKNKMKERKTSLIFKKRKDVAKVYFEKGKNRMNFSFCVYFLFIV